MADVPGGKFGFFSVIAHIIQAASSRKKRKAQSLKALADRKFSEIEATHKLFICLLESMAETVSSTSEKLVRSDDIDIIHKSFIDSIQAIQKARSQDFDTRRKYYHEAEIYSEQVLQDRGIFNTLSPDIAEKLKDLMTSYANYSRSDGKYAHELGRILTGNRSSLWLAMTSPPKFSKGEFADSIDELRTVVDDAIALSRERWSIVVRDYHKFNLCLLEHDLI
jgi:hypothetical protein